MWGRVRWALERVFSAKDWLPIIERTARRNAIAITFDDGPSPATTPGILDLLRTQGVTATFFLCGNRVAQYPALVKAIVAAGHSVYAHGFDHVRMDAIPPERFFANLDRTEVLLSRVRPTPSPYFIRLPYGAGHHTLRVHRMLRDWRPDCVLAHWGYSLEDFRLADGCATEADLVDRCVVAADDAFSRGHFNGSIVLMHEDPLDVDAPLSARVAPILLREILTRARRRGLAIVGLHTPRPRRAPPIGRTVAVG